MTRIVYCLCLVSLLAGCGPSARYHQSLGALRAYKTINTHHNAIDKIEKWVEWEEKGVITPRQFRALIRSVVNKHEQR